MNIDRNLSLMRGLYISLLAETMVRYARAGALEEIENERRSTSLASGEMANQMLGVTTPAEAFTTPASIAECAAWEITEIKTGLVASCQGCKLIQLCRNLDAPSPCRMYCLNPIEGMIKALIPAARFEVKSTLWSGDNCTVEVAWQ